MNYSKKIKAAMDFYILDLQGKPLIDFDFEDLEDEKLHELTAILMDENRDLAAEATGPDNDDYGSHMLPSLLGMLSNPYCSDAKRIFEKNWKNGVTNYCYPHLQKLFDDRLEELNK